MAYDTSNLDQNRGGSTAENTDQGEYPAGLYKHDNGAELITTYDPLFGNAQSEGAVRLGFKFVRPAEEGEIKTILEVVLDEKAKTSTESLVERLAKLEKAQEETTAVEAENADLKAQLAALNAAKKENKTTKKEDK